MLLNINKKSFAYFFLGFTIFTGIGTVSHEVGHIIVAESLGYGTTLHYGNMNWNKDNGWEEVDKISTTYQYEIENNLKFDKKEEYDNIVRKLKSDRFKIVLGGVLQTIIFGSVGFLLLLIKLKSIKKNGLKIIDWIFVFLSLFWLLEVFNLIFDFLSAIVQDNNIYFYGDEVVISERLNLFSGTISIILGICGIVIVSIVVFRIIPSKERLTFISAGLSGGIFGYFLWMIILGPLILP